MSLIPFQWSIKLDDGQIYMVQTETFEELMLAKDEIETKALNHTIKVDAGTTVTPIQPGLVCKTCGKPATKQEGTNKNGNPYTLIKCSGNYKHNWFEN